MFAGFLYIKSYLNTFYCIIFFLTVPFHHTIRTSSFNSCFVFDVYPYNYYWLLHFYSQKYNKNNGDKRSVKKQNQSSVVETASPIIVVVSEWEESDCERSELTSWTRHFHRHVRKSQMITCSTAEPVTINRTFFPSNWSHSMAVSKSNAVFSNAAQTVWPGNVRRSDLNSSTFAAVAAP